MLLLRHVSPARLEFHQRGGWGAPVLTGVVLGAFALSPLLAPGPLTPSRAAFAATLGAIAVALAVLSRPRERGVRVALDGGFIDAGSARFALAKARGIALTSGGSTLEASARVRYRAEVVLEGGTRVVLLEDSDPSRVIHDLRRTLGYWPLPVTTSGWGLAPGAEPWRVHSAPERAEIGAPIEERGRPAESELGTGLSVLGGAVVVGTAMALMHSGRVHRGEPTEWFSYLLSGSLLGFIVVLGIFMVSDRVTARLENGQLAVERRALGIAWSRVRVPVERLSALHAVGLVPGEPRHLLIETADEIFAVAFVGEGATRLAARVAEWSRALPVSPRP